MIEIPRNITREHLLKAIEKIDIEGIPKDGESRYYDLIYQQKTYPPKLVLSYANLFANGQILDRNDFEGGIGTPCFRILEEKGFIISTKNNSVSEKIKLFAKAYKTEVENRHSSELKSFKILVNELPEVLKAHITKLGPNIKIKGSIGAGVNTYYPWVGIFDLKVSTGATNGFYVVLLFSDDFEDLYLTLNQGSTIQTQEQIDTYRKYVYSKYDNIDGFVKGRIPERGLVKTKSGTATKNGKKYEETNIFYKQYKIASLNEEDFISNLNKIVEAYIDCADTYSKQENIPTDKPITKLTNMNFDYKEFYNSLKSSNLILDEFKTVRFICSLLTKPFVILTGLSGSGKTKLAQAFAMWICENDIQYYIVPVGADWTNREPLLGFPNALKENEYVKPDNRVLDLIIEANKNPYRPYFLILDEMNLSHVERYFADFLSVMESKSKIPLHSGNEDWNGVPVEIGFSENLFIIGTVNIDETTYMFSPKVLDRANVIEFRVTATEMQGYLQNNSGVDLQSLRGKGATSAEYFLNIASDRNLEVEDIGKLNESLMVFFTELKKTGAEFGYRSAFEIQRFAAIVRKIEPNWRIENIVDAAIMQKLLPKVHGSRRKLEPILKTLGTLCLGEGQKFDEFISIRSEVDFSEVNKIKYPISLEKILRMYDNLISNGFTSYAEA